MDGNQYSELLAAANSPDFDCLLCIFQISLHGDNLGVEHFLVSKLASYPYSEVEFYIPQLIQILISFESDSMALSDFILDHSRKYPHFCLIAFWNLQAYVFELKNEPDSYSFHVVRNFINNLQDIMFNQHCEGGNMLRENLHPALMIGAAIASSLGLPDIHSYIKPVILSQGRQQKSFLFKLANFHKALTRNLTLKNTGKPIDLGSSGRDSGEETEIENDVHQRYSESVLTSTRRLSKTSTFAIDDLEDASYNSDYSEDHKLKRNKPLHTRKALNQRLFPSNDRLSAHSVDDYSTSHDDNFSSKSMPDLIKHIKDLSISENSITPIISNSSSISLASMNNIKHRSASSKVLQEYDSALALRVNYFKNETEFMMVLQNISSRLSHVPKEARLTSLRAELSIINGMMLPSQIDIPQLLPLSSSPNRKYHRILKLNVNEACVLNSAERVPYLLLIEYLSEDMDFDPTTEKNKSVLLKGNLKVSKRATSTEIHYDEDISAPPLAASANEADLGDISVVALSNEKQRLQVLGSNMTKDFGFDSDTPTKIRGVPIEHKHPRTTTQALQTLASNVSSKDLSAQIRIAAVMLKQLEKSGQANSEQSAAIKSRIISSMEALQDQFESIDYQQIRDLSAVHGADSEQDAGERKIENDFKIGEDWATKRARIRNTSAFGHLPHWDLCSVIVKNGDDLQQEAFACQLISVISHIWKREQVGVWTKNMKIVVTSSHSGLVETINNALSVHSIKKTMTELSVKSGQNPKGTVASLKDYFLKIYGDETTPKFKTAQENFARSLASASIICYVLQIKDRHNGNIMLDNEGHIIHIDFGFILSNSPGSVGFEAAPFKLSIEYLDVLGGVESRYFKLFQRLCKECFLSLRKNCTQLINLVEMMQKDSSLPCFKFGAQTSALLKQRLQLDLSEEDCNQFVEHALIGKSMGSVYTRLYDQFQLLTQGIYS